MTATEPASPTAAAQGVGSANLRPPDVRFRPLRFEDADALCELLLAARAVDGPREHVTCDELRHLWFEHPGIDLETDSVVAIAPDDSLVAAIAVFTRESPTKLARAFMPGTVRPTHRRRGIGTLLIHRAEHRARELLAAVPLSIPRQLDAESPASAQDRRALLELLGFRQARSFVTMLRQLEAPVEVAALPDGLVATTWRPELDAATRDAHNDAFRDHWGSDPLSGERWRHFVAGMPGFRAESSWLAVAGGGGSDVAGYTLTSLNDVDGERVGWLGTIGVRRAWRHQGVASALIGQSLATFRSLGATSAGLDVDAENPTGAVRIYEALGFRRTGESIIYSKPLEP